MIYRCICITLAIFAVSCGAGDNVLYATYKANLDDFSKIQQIEHRMREIAEHWGLKVHEKNRDEMATLTQGKPAFYIELYLEEHKPILWITNAGSGEVIAFVASDYGGIPHDDLERLVQFVLEQMKTLNLEFHLEAQDRKT